MKKVFDFLDDRTGYRKLLAHALDEPIKGGSRWLYVFGSVLLGMFVVQAVTGVALMTSYAPSETTAWASVHYIQFTQSGGWLVRGLHHFGAQAMVILLAAHMLQVAAFGAYRKPREVTWWLGLSLLGLVLGFALTGYLLPWDQKGYWATRVATNIAGTVPIVGAATQKLAQGGPEYGSLTLTRFYALHVGVLPALVVFLVTAHVALFRKHGVTPAAKADLSKVESFHPAQLAKDVFATVFVLGIVLVFAIREHGAPLDAPADPSSDYPARPEWYFLGLFQLLKYFHGPLEVVGTVGLPTVVGLYLFALPFLDRAPTTALRGRIKAVAPLGIIALGVTLLTVQAIRDDARDEAFKKQRDKATELATTANRLAMGGVPPAGPLVMMNQSWELKGPLLFDKHCAGCHTLRDHGVEKDRTAPKLDGWGTEAWALSMLKDPDADDRFGRTFYKGEMKPIEKDREVIAHFLASQEKGSPGEQMVKTRCTTCHTYGGEGDDSATGLAPELDGWGTQEWLKAQILNPATKKTYRENALDLDRKGHMPRFDDEMSPDDADRLARWILSLR